MREDGGMRAAVLGEQGGGTKGGKIQRKEEGRWEEGRGGGMSEGGGGGESCRAGGEEQTQ